MRRSTGCATASVIVCGMFLLGFTGLSPEHEKTWVESMALSRHHPEDLSTPGEVPGPDEQRLLERFRPRIYVAPGDAGPIDFYRDYLPHVRVRSLKGGRVLDEKPTREKFQTWSRDPGVFLDYEGSPAPENARPCAYARVRREHVNILEFGKFRPRTFAFLSYTFVFLHGGLPALLPAQREFFARFLGKPEAWQELSVNCAVHIVLDERESVIALVLGQYHYHRTLLRGIHFDLSSDGRIELSLSKQSHQPYLHPAGVETTVQHRAVYDLRHLRFLMLGGKEPLFFGFDLVYSEEGGAREVSYELEFLPQFDPLFTARISLGEGKNILGKINVPFRSSPLGIDFLGYPELSEMGNLMQFWYLRDGDAKQAEFMQDNLRDRWDINFDAVLLRNGAYFGQDLLGVEEVRLNEAGQHADT